MYPTNYNNISKEQMFLEDLKDKACVVFITNELNKINPTVFPDLYTPNVIRKLIESKDFLLIIAEDVDDSYTEILERPNIQQMYQIDDFLKRHSNDEILSICDAGIARSGFVTLWLDIVNRKDLDIIYNIGGKFPELTKRTKDSFYVSNPAYTKFLGGLDFLNEEEKEILKKLIKNRG